MASISRTVLLQKTAAELATFLPVRDVDQLCGGLAVHARIFRGGLVVLVDQFCEYAVLPLEAACEQHVLSRMDEDTKRCVIADLAYFRGGEYLRSCGDDGVVPDLEIYKQISDFAVTYNEIGAQP